MIKVNKDFFDFIAAHSNADPYNLLLKEKKNIYNFDLDFALTQIKARKKNTTKLKDFLIYPDFVFPDSLSGEQASHQAVAKFHSTLAADSNSVLDLTAGLGIDSFSFSRNNCFVTAIEMDNQRAEAIQHNSNILQLKNFKVKNAEAIEFLKSDEDRYDLIFIDPARRDSQANRVYNLRECSPNIIGAEKVFFQHAPRVLVKASPLLDVTQTLKDLKNITKLYAIGVKGECKELLIEMKKDKIEDLPISINAVNLDTDGNITSYFEDSLAQNPSPHIEYTSLEEIEEGKFLLEPSAMIMKFMPWETICKKFKARKFDKASNLFLTSEHPFNFPGRITKVSKIIQKKDRKTLAGLPASVISRNHPISSEEIRNSLKLKEGDLNFIYASKIEGKPVMILSEKIN